MLDPTWLRHLGGRPLSMFSRVLRVPEVGRESAQCNRPDVKIECVCISDGYSVERVEPKGQANGRH